MSSDVNSTHIKSKAELADVFTLYANHYRSNHKLPLNHHRVLNDIQRCRTAALGGHIDECLSCGALRISYNSCRNRHCPKCQHSKMLQWVQARKNELLPIQYFHVVFTLPDEINRLAAWNDRLIYDLLFKAASQTLLEFGSRHLNGEIGITAVLHTWGQTLHQHIHLHCIVTGGALTKDRQWRSCPRGFLFSVKALAIVFRAKYCDLLAEAVDSHSISLPPGGDGSRGETDFHQTLKQIRKKKWVVYSKMPFAGPERVIEYIGRYTHRVAISNSRILNISEGEVTFRYKDYRDADRIKVMTLSAEEFIRRFLLHVLPEGFVRIRHYGLFANGRKQAKLSECRQLIADRDERSDSGQTEAEGFCGEDPWRCPSCGRGRMVVKATFDEGAGPPVSEGGLLAA